MGGGGAICGPLDLPKDPLGPILSSWHAADQYLNPGYKSGLGFLYIEIGTAASFRLGRTIFFRPVVASSTLQYHSQL